MIAQSGIAKFRNARFEIRNADWLREGWLPRRMWLRVPSPKALRASLRRGKRSLTTQFVEGPARRTVIIYFTQGM